MNIFAAQHCSVAARQRRAFTIIELLIVIGVILLLVALTVTVGTGIVRQSEVRETENTMRLLDAAVHEWELAADRRVSYGVDGEPCEGALESRYELQQHHGAGTTWPNESAAFDAAKQTTNELWALLARTSAVRDVLARVDPQYFEELEISVNGQTRRSYRVLDTWGQPILAIMPGRSYNRRTDSGCTVDTAYDISSDRQTDDDGTIRTPYENRFGVAANRRIFFVSAGPSGVFGDLSADPNDDDYRDAQDNIYSYEVIRP